MAATFDFSSKFLSELPPNTPELIAPDVKSIKAALRRQLGQTPDIDFIILSSVPPHAISRLIIDPRAGGDPKPLRMFYNADVRKLIINRPKFPLEITTGYFTTFIMCKPNASYMVEETLRLRHKWPNYVIETGFEDMLGRLRLHKEWWFGQSGGQVRGVLIVGVSRTTRRVVIENWTQRGGSPIKEQEVSISGDEEGVAVVAGDTLRIKFENLFLRPASDDTEGDLVFPREWLEKLAARVWRYLPFE
ncbi:hypothetical protein CNMCM5623_002593 [Aspergillus felis]|uniref:Uncharacterized protein n=1 Tax=Aspergillus felis TaxID=1287682 RepID=A0A8H6PNZ6_9EURO|nr:hypothetical protein CNMCM5623_002593 [Aspergillus felis]